MGSGRATASLQELSPCRDSPKASDGCMQPPTRQTLPRPDCTNCVLLRRGLADGRGEYGRYDRTEWFDAELEPQLGGVRMWRRYKLADRSEWEKADVEFTDVRAEVVWPWALDALRDRLWDATISPARWRNDVYPNAEPPELVSKRNTLWSVAVCGSACSASPHLP